jgi:vitamin B12 transporter
LGLVGLVAAFHASSAFAEDGPIVVTATHTPTPLASIPARVQVIDRDTIERQSLGSLAQAIGADAVQSGGPGQQTSLFLRGTNSSHVLGLLDGIKLNDASNPNDQYDFGQDGIGALERIEILRGPASSIYGSDAIGGVVNIIPRRGGDKTFSPYFEGAFGSFNTKRGHAGAAGTVGKLEYGLTGELLDTDGYDIIPKRMTTHTGDKDGAFMGALTGAAKWDLGLLSLDVLARTRHSEVEYDTFSGGPLFDLRADATDLKNEADQNVWRLGAEKTFGEAFTLRLSGGQVTSDRTETEGGFQTSAAQAEQDFADLVGSYKVGSTTLTAGLSYFSDSIETQPQFADPLNVKEDRTAAFLIAQTGIGAHVDLTGSVRVDDYESFGTQTTYTIGGVARVGPARLFASYGEAFKAPSLSERFEQSFFNIGNPNLKPEESKTWEVGGDLSFVDGRLKLGGSYYQSEIDQLIQYNFGALQNVNVAKASIEGVEAFATVAPVSWGSLGLSYAWTDARDDATDRRLARRPENALRIEAKAEPTTRSTLTLTWQFVGPRKDVLYDDGGNFTTGYGTLAGYNVGALAGTFDLDDRAELFARIDNLTDETYEQPAAFAGAPRSALVGVRVKL